MEQPTLLEVPRIGPKARDEWYSRAYVVEPARRRMGGIALDVASCAHANRTVQAARYFSWEEDGLAQNWVAASAGLAGGWWENGPWLDGAIERWLIYSHRQLMQEGARPLCVLLPLTPAEAWWPLVATAWLAIHKGRMTFQGPNSTGSGSPPFGSVVAYWGPAPGRFVHEYQQPQHKGRPRFHDFRAPSQEGDFPW